MVCLAIGRPLFAEPQSHCKIFSMSGKKTDPNLQDRQGEDWPDSFHTREELDALLEEGFASGRSEKTHEEIIAEARRELKLG